MTSTDTHTSETTQPRDFVAFLLEQSQGKTNSELSAGLHRTHERRRRAPHRHRQDHPQTPRTRPHRIRLLPRPRRKPHQPRPNQRSIFEVVNQTTGEVTD